MPGSFKRSIAAYLRRDTFAARWVDGFAAVAVAVVIVRLALLEADEILPLGAEVGILLTDLALAYLAAWLFNLLVIELPRIDSMHRIFTAYGPQIDRLGAGALAVMQSMNSALSRPEVLEVSQSDAEYVFARLAPSDASPLLIGGAPGAWVYAPWITALDYYRLQQAEAHVQLLPAYTYFDARFIVLLNAVTESSYLKMVKKLHDVGTTNTDLNFLVPTFMAYASACDRLRLEWERIRPG